MYLIKIKHREFIHKVAMVVSSPDFTFNFFLLMVLVAIAESASQRGGRQFYLFDSKTSDEEKNALNNEAASSTHRNNKRNDSNGSNNGSNNDSNSINKSNDSNGNKNGNNKNKVENVDNENSGQVGGQAVSGTECTWKYTCLTIRGRYFCYWKKVCTSTG